MKLNLVKTMKLVQVEKQYVKKTKCRKYDIKYLSFGFTYVGVDGKERPQYLLCRKI
jgi:hypothetical protein